MKRLFILFIFVCTCCFSQTKPFPKLAFGKGVTAVYVGSGAASRHLDWTKFKQETESYRRSPFIAVGFDKCILPRASNAYWGLGVYVSSWLAKRQYVDIYENRKESIWSNSLIALRATHHNSFFVTEKLDMCTGFIVGTRLKYYHSKIVNDKEVSQNANKTTLYPAFGVTFTARYYFYKNTGFYVDAALGYKVDFVSFGLVYKIHS